jgi:predicted esterase
MQFVRLAGCLLALALGSHVALPPHAHASPAASATERKPWCAPEVHELSDHVCYFDGGARSDGRRTLVIYLHGMLATTPGFQYVQQRAMALHAKNHHFAVLLPTSPLTRGGYLWPTSVAAQKEEEATVIAGLHAARAKLEQRLGRPFDEVFVVGFSSGAYYASSLVLRAALDVDGYIVLAGAASWSRPRERSGPPDKRAPVFVGVSAADRATASDSRAFGGTLSALGWPHRVEERNAGHMVDWTFMAHGIAWLREQADRHARND